MVLTMSRPWKHPKTGTYYLRKRVPADLRGAVGSEIVKITLGTKNPILAKSLHLKALADLEARWANLRLGEQKLTERVAHLLANRTFVSWVRFHRDEPSIQHFWHTNLYDRLWNEPLFENTLENVQKFGAKRMHDNILIHEMRRFCYKRTVSCLEFNCLTIDASSRTKLERAIGAAFQRASKEIERMAQGYDQSEDMFIPLKTINSKSSDVMSLHLRSDVEIDNLVSKNSFGTNSIVDLLESWWRENKAAGRKESTYESYRNTIKYFVRFLGHDDAKRVTVENVIAFKDYRLTTPSPKTGRVASAKTVKDSDLSALKTLFGWAVANRKVPENPTAGVTIKVAKPARLRSKGFSDAEAVAILTAARDYENTHEHPGTAAAKRWVPWLCAFTGARVGEIAQLRRQDVRQENGRYVLRITPEAGTVKTNEAREIVLHPQLVALGFPTFVQTSVAGPLFIRTPKDGNVLGPLQGLKNRLAEFARSIVSDPNVAPNHGWRHRFKTIGMEVGIAPRILDAIQGQAARTVADTYGEVTLKTIAAAIDRLPYFELRSK